jgi:hypothetical protein
MQEFHDSERALTDALRAVAAEDTRAGASPAVRAQLLEEVRLVRRAHRASLMKMYALAAGLFLATAVPIWQLAMHAPPDRATIRLNDVSDGEVATAFFPLTYSDVPVTEGNLVRVEVSQAAFVSFGVEPLEPPGSPGSDVVLADVLVGEDGLARAVRFVRTKTIEEQQEPQP